MIFTEIQSIKNYAAAKNKAREQSGLELDACLKVGNEKMNAWRALLTTVAVRWAGTADREIRCCKMRCKKIGTNLWHGTFCSLGIQIYRIQKYRNVSWLVHPLSLSRLSPYKQRFFRKLITPNLCILRSNFLCNVTFIVAARSSGSLACLFGVVSAAAYSLECAHCAWK